MNPLSMASSWGKSAKSSAEEKQPSSDDARAIPRTAFGVVNKAGEIVDESGKAIGKVADSDNLPKLVGHTVTAAGDVVNSSGDVMGKTSVDSEYIIQGSEDKKQSGGSWNLLGKTKGAAQTADNVQGPVKSALGMKDSLSKSGGTSADSVGQDSPSSLGDKKMMDTSVSQSNTSIDAPDSSVGGKVPSPVQLEDNDISEAEVSKKVGDEHDTLEAQSPTPIDESEKTALDASKSATDAAEGTVDDAQQQDVSVAAEDEVSNVKDEAEKAKEPLDLSVLEGTTVNKGGNLVNSDGDVIGRLAEGDAKDLQDKTADEEGNIRDESGEVVGRAEPIVELEKLLDLSILKGTKVNKEGNLVNSDGDVVGRLAEGDAKDLRDKTADEEGNIRDESGEIIGRAEPLPEFEKVLDFSVLKGTKVNKAGNLVNDDGDIIGRLMKGDAKELQGKAADEDGNIWNDSGKIIGRAQPVPESERQDMKDFAPFENFPDAIVESDGRVTSGGKQVGSVVEGDPKRLKGSHVDEDGDIVDRRGNVIGKAEAWDEPEAEVEEAPDLSALAGMRVNKRGNVVDPNGAIVGRVVEGNLPSLVGRMCNKEGHIMSESGEKIGQAELIPEDEREESREGPFADLGGCTVTKDGKVVTASGEVVGRLVSGDGKVLNGRAVDEDGDVIDKSGNVLGKAERWEEPEVEKDVDPLAGCRVNRDGNVVDDDGKVIGKLVSGDATTCAGKMVDDDGDVVNAKGNAIGHVALLDEEAEKDKKLAGQLAGSIDQSLEKIRPICKMITNKVDAAESTPKEELDEEALVREVKPLIEEGGKILTEANGMIRGMDPDGRIQRNAKHKSATKDASPEEYHLADVVKELTDTVSETIDNAKAKIEGMPHAKKELNPLWGLLSEPLFQILAAVGLLLSGVLGLVGKLLGGLGLGGIVDSLLGGLGVNKILDSIGIGGLTGKKKEKKK